MRWRSSAWVPALVLACFLLVLWAETAGSTPQSTTPAPSTQTPMPGMMINSTQIYNGHATFGAGRKPCSGEGTAVAAVESPSTKITGYSSSSSFLAATSSSACFAAAVSAASLFPSNFVAVALSSSFACFASTASAVTADNSSTTILNCAGKCLKTPNCNGFAYNDLNRQCYLKQHRCDVTQCDWNSPEGDDKNWYWFYRMNGTLGCSSINSSSSNISSSPPPMKKKEPEEKKKPEKELDETCNDLCQPYGGKFKMEQLFTDPKTAVGREKRVDGLLLFREEVKYCRDDNTQHCFAKKLKEDCGKAKELRRSKAGPACTNEKGKAIGNVFLITISESDKCVVMGVKKEQIQEGVQDVTDMVLADTEIYLPGYLPNQGSEADALVNSTSCSAFGSTLPSLRMKYGSMFVSLFGSVSEITWKVKKQSAAWACCVGVFGSALCFHTLWIFASSGCAQFQAVYGYEVFTTALGFLLLAYTTSTDTKNDSGKSRSCRQIVMEQCMLCVTVVAIGSDIWGFIEGETCAILGLQGTLIVLNVLSLCVRMCILCRYYGGGRDSSGVSETERTSAVESSLGYVPEHAQADTGAEYAKGGQPIARF